MCEQIWVESSDKNGACSDKIKNAIRESEYQDNAGKKRLSHRPKVNLQKQTWVGPEAPDLLYDNVMCTMIEIDVHLS